ncbi:MAG: chemotaxis protein CheW [Acidimicrobiales bacterium]
MSTGPGRPSAGGTTIAAPEPDRSVDDTQAILDERARALARPARSEQIGELVAVVAFVIGGVRHAFEARFVREVLLGPDVSTVPSAPPAVIGVTNVRGEILAVADISALLGVAAPPARGPVVVLDGPAPSLGVLVDQVHDFVNLPAESISPLPGNGGPGERAGASLVLGASSDAVILSADAVLRDPRLSAADPRSDR